MSGSPIVQNGKLIGAVTYIFVNDPTRGYGMFIENMPAEAGKINSFKKHTNHPFIIKYIFNRKEYFKSTKMYAKYYCGKSLYIVYRDLLTNGLQILGRVSLFL